MLNLSVGGIEVFKHDSPLVAVSEQMCIAKIHNNQQSQNQHILNIRVDIGPLYLNSI